MPCALVMRSIFWTRKPEQKSRQRRPEIDRQEVGPWRRGQPDAAVEGPGRAVDAQGQSVDIRAADQAAALVGPAVAVRSDREQHAQIEQRNEQDEPAVSTGSAPAPRHGRAVSRSCPAIRRTGRRVSAARRRAADRSTIARAGKFTRAGPRGRRRADDCAGVGRHRVASQARSSMRLTWSTRSRVENGLVT